MLLRLDNRSVCAAMQTGNAQHRGHDFRAASLAGEQIGVRLPQCAQIVLIRFDPSEIDLDLIPIKHLTLPEPSRLRSVRSIACPRCHILSPGSAAVAPTPRRCALAEDGPEE